MTTAGTEKPPSATDSPETGLNQDILKGIEIHGSSELTADYLIEQGLTPANEIHVSDESVRIWTSPYFKSHSGNRGHVATIAYVQKDEKTTAHTYYLSRSQGNWRVLPSYTEYGDGSIHYDKGWDEQSVTLPADIQKQLSADFMSKDLDEMAEPEHPELAFFGTATKRLGTDAERQGDFYDEVKRTPKALRGRFYSVNSDTKTPPEGIQLTDEESPDFSQRFTSWEQGSGQYGVIKSETFPSKDGKLIYTFSQDSKGRVWISHLENPNSEIGSTGLKTNWVDGGDLVTPALEYDSQSGGYGKEVEQLKHYSDMFDNYLIKIPVIKEYITHTNPIDRFAEDLPFYMDALNPSVRLLDKENYRKLMAKDPSVDLSGYAELEQGDEVRMQTVVDGKGNVGLVIPERMKQEAATAKKAHELKERLDNLTDEQPLEALKSDVFSETNLNEILAVIGQNINTPETIDYFDSILGSGWSKNAVLLTALIQNKAETVVAIENGESRQKEKSVPELITLLVDYITDDEGQLQHQRSDIEFTALALALKYIFAGTQSDSNNYVKNRFNNILRSVRTHHYDPEELPS